MMHLLCKYPREIFMTGNNTYKLGIDQTCTYVKVLLIIEIMLLSLFWGQVKQVNILSNPVNDKLSPGILFVDVGSHFTSVKIWLCKVQLKFHAAKCSQTKLEGNPSTRYLWETLQVDIHQTSIFVFYRHFHPRINCHTIWQTKHK